MKKIILVRYTQWLAPEFAQRERILRKKLEEINL